MSHCVDCTHWDEEAADEDGRAPCVALYCALLDSECIGEGPIRYTTDGDCLLSIRTRGDFGCALFHPKRVASAPTQVPSEAE
jgi:hypothetical protein